MQSQHYVMNGNQSEIVHVNYYQKDDPGPGLQQSVPVFQKEIVDLKWGENDQLLELSQQL